MEKLGDLIKTRLDRHNLSAPAKAAEVLYFTNQLLQSELDAEGENVKAVKLEGGNLVIHVPSSVWSQEVWGMQEFILNKLKKRFGETSVKKIRIKSLTIK